MENRVGFWPRVAAALVDFVLFTIIAVLLKGVIASALPDVTANKIAEMTANPKTASMRGFLTGMASWTIAAGLLGPIYNLIEGLFGTSPGKLLLGLRIVSETGQPGSHSTLLLRYLVKSSGNLVAFAAVFVALKPLDIVSQVLSWAIILGFFLVLTASRQALHDKIAGTAVLRKSDIGVGVPAQQPSGAI